METSVTTIKKVTTSTDNIIIVAMETRAEVVGDITTRIQQQVIITKVVKAAIMVVCTINSTLPWLSRSKATHSLLSRTKVLLSNNSSCWAHSRYFCALCYLIQPSNTFSWSIFLRKTGANPTTWTLTRMLVSGRSLWSRLVIRLRAQFKLRSFLTALKSTSK